MVTASKEMQEYFEEMKNKIKSNYEIAKKTKNMGFDPNEEIEIKLAENLAERVVGLISVIAPQITDSDVVPRIVELEKKYGILDWRVAFQIALEIAQQKFCKFKDQKEAMEVGIKLGFAYVTVGVVSSPLEGLTDIEIKKTNDNKDYFCLNFAGPIRNAGGTAASVAVLIADYVRKHMGYAKYDATDKEAERCYTELIDYHNRIANLQYVPSKEEIVFMIKNLPVEISGLASEKIEVSNHKNLPRIKTNFLRSGYCLINSSCIPLKAPKLWKKIGKWGKDFGMEQWNFLEEFLEIQHKAKAGESSKKEETQDTEKEDKKELPYDIKKLIEPCKKIDPIYTYIQDLVAGRPVFSHPGRSGGFRLRYGRSRTSGYSAQSVHPATLAVMNDFLTTATQVKVERPGKAAALTSCDTIEGPVVLLNNGNVVELKTEKQALSVKEDIKEILYVGDILINYGDFLDRAHDLCYPGYCEEWWSQELEKEIDENIPGEEREKKIRKLSELIGISEDVIKGFINDPLNKKPSCEISLKLSEYFNNLPFHPAYTYFWNQFSMEELHKLLKYLSLFNLHTDQENNIEKIILPYGEEYKEPKRILEKAGIPHFMSGDEFLVMDSQTSRAILKTCCLDDKEKYNSFYRYISDILQKENELLKDGRLKEKLGGNSNIVAINEFSSIKIRDKAGTFIGARMGRPEKAKMRKMQTGPHGLFPLGEEGGKFRSFHEAFNKGKIKTEFELWWDEKEGQESIFPVNYKTGNKCVKKYWDNKEKMMLDQNKEDSWVKESKIMEYDFRSHFDWCLKRMKTKVYPDLIKGVLGTASSIHSPENPMKAILRAKHEIFVNKDGTVRYDGSEVPITHFKPKEIGTSIQKLKQLGYTHDIYGEPVTDNNQIIELKCQDVVLPACKESPNEGADQVFLRTAKFIDDELQYLYGMDKYYNAKKVEDIIGEKLIVLAPHTSAGITGRIIGFSKVQGLFCHPLMHAAIRRDCFHYDTYLPIKYKGRWINKKIGEIYNEINKYKKSKVVDSYGTEEIKVINYKTIGLENGKLKEVNINNFTKHNKRKFISLITKLGRNIKTTIEHKHITDEGIKRANELREGDKIKLPKKINVKTKDVKILDLIKIFKNEEWVMVKGLKKELIKKGLNLKSELKKQKVENKNLQNYYLRDSIPINISQKIIKRCNVNKNKLKLSEKRDKFLIPAVINVDSDFLKIIGLYISEGYSRKIDSSKGLYQVYISAKNNEVRNFIEKYFKSLGLKKSERKNDRITYSSRILYYLFTTKLFMGSLAKEKRIPSIFYNLPKQKILSLLSGYLEGDGSVSSNQKRIQFDTVSEGLLEDISFVLNRFGIFVKRKYYTKKPGKKVKNYYLKKGLSIPEFSITKGTIQSMFIDSIKEIKFISKLKQKKFRELLNIKSSKCQLKFDNNYIYDEVINIKELPEEVSYCLNVPENVVVANNLITMQCDGDEAGVFLLMDAFINFSTKYLNNKLGGTMDAPLVLTSVLNPTEVDDMVFNIEKSGKYPLDFYKAASEGKKPWDFKMPVVEDDLGKETQYEGYKFTHDTDDFNNGVKCSAYKLLPSMKEKMQSQMELGKKIRSVDVSDMAKIVIEKHFIKDIKGNLRKFSQQVFRCSKCNTKYRRPPLSGRCTECNAKNIIFTVTEGSIKKYVGYSLELAKEYNLPEYLQETIELVEEAINSIFGKEKEKQEGLSNFFG
ncbi:MAG: DNA polymerase II large subunit [Nanobdellota archaeon]